MNKTSMMFVFAAMACAAAIAKPAVVESVSGRAPIAYALPAALTNQLAALQSRPVCERVVIEDGLIVENWREGSREWVVTNRPLPVVGDRLKSTFTERMAKVEADVAKWREAWTNSQVVAEMQRRRAERSEARFNNATNQLQIAIDNAKLPTTKLLLQAILDAIINAADGK